MLSSETLLGMRSSANTAAAAAAALIDPNGYVVSSETSSTSFGAGLARDSLGVKGTLQRFAAVAVAAPSTSAWRVIVRAPWTLTTQSVGINTRGTLRATLFVAGVQVATALGAARNLNAANTTPYVELIVLDVPAGTPVTIGPGTQIEVTLQPEVTIVSGTPGSTWEPTLRHDPQTVGSQLVVEFQGTAGVH